MSSPTQLVIVIAVSAILCLPLLVMWFRKRIAKRRGWVPVAAVLTAFYFVAGLFSTHACGFNGFNEGPHSGYQALCGAILMPAVVVASFSAILPFFPVALLGLAAAVLLAGVIAFFEAKFWRRQM